MVMKTATIWLTGLPASGKTTIAQALCDELRQANQQAVVLDGDALRHGVSQDLGFSQADRNEHIRRVGAMACVLNQQGVYAIASVISPYANARKAVRALHDEQNLPFYEVFVDTPLEVCIKRDPKGLYAKALAGQLQGLTGVGAPYEAPTYPDLVIATLEEPAQRAARRIIAQLL